MPQYEELGVKQVKSSAEDAVLVTPSDSTDLAKGYTKGIYLGVGGDLVVTLRSGATVTFTNLSAGVIHAISATRVKSTGTTASNILALY
jgi:hypothetical protein